MTALAGRRILGARGADGRVHAPPFEYDPATGEPPAELVEVGSGGHRDQLDLGAGGRWTASRWRTRSRWALIRLDGADTAMLHAVDAGLGRRRCAPGMRVRPRWAASSGRAHPRHRLLRAVAEALPAPPGPAGGAGRASR